VTKPKYKDRLTEMMNQLQFTDISWQDEAACQAQGNEIFFADPSFQKSEIAQAKAICKTCDVRWKCLEFAIKNDIMHGIWGGFTPTERNSYMKGRTL
jgi:WhiB family redox-sensing transcriptional regulator